MFKPIKKEMDVTQFDAIAAGGCIALLFIVRTLIRFSWLSEPSNALLRKYFLYPFLLRGHRLFRPLDSYPGSLPGDLLSSQYSLHLLQGVYRKRCSDTGGVFIAQQHGVGLLRIALELYLHLTWSFAAQLPTFP